MLTTNRFGRRLPIPSTRQIRHELLMFGAREGERLKDVDRPKDESGAAELASHPDAPPQPRP